MQSSARFQNWVILGFVALLIPTASRADYYLHVWENHYQREKTLVLSPEIQQFSSDSNFDALGVKNIPINFTSLSRTQADLNARFGLVNWLSVYGRLSWARQVVTGTALSDNSNQLGTVYGLPDQTAGINARVLRGRVLIDLQVQADIPFYTNAPVSSTSSSSTSSSSSSTSSSSTTSSSTVATQTLPVPFLGDGTMDFSGGAFATWPFLRIKNHALSAVAGGGLTYRTQGFSMALPYSAVLRIDPYTQGPRALVGIYGFQSLKNDVYTSSTAVSTVSCSGAGGSCITNAVNPSAMYLRGQVGYQFDPRMNFSVTYAMALAGQVIPNSTAIIGAFQMGFDFSGKKGPPISQDPSSKSPSTTTKRSSPGGFVNYSLEATIKKVNDRMGLLKLDKGGQDGIEEGQNFDVFTPAKGGKSEAVARASCVSTTTDEATLKIVEYYREVWIEEGFVVKRPME